MGAKWEILQQITNFTNLGVYLEKKWKWDGIAKDNKIQRNIKIYEKKIAIGLGNIRSLGQCPECFYST